MNRSGLVRAWPIAAAAVLSACLAMGLARDFAWVLWGVILALLIFGWVRVAQESAHNANTTTRGDRTGPQ